MSYIGSTKIGKMFLGNTEIAKAYLGNDMVFEKGGTGHTLVFYDRLIFDGTAYIETDIIPDANATYRVIVGYETQKVAQRVFSLQAGTSDQTGINYTSSTTATNRAIGAYYGAASALLAKTLAFSTKEYSLFMTPKRFGWGSTSYTITKGSSIPSGGLILGSNPAHTGQAFTGKMRRFRVYGSDAQNVSSDTDLNSYTPAYTLRPCTYDGEAGIWCEELAKFYGNSAGAGTLTVENIS